MPGMKILFTSSNSVYTKLVFMHCNYITSKIKVKISHYSHSCTKGERRHSSYSFLTLAPGEGVVSVTPWACFTTGLEAAWAAELVWTKRLEAKFFASAGD
jgi:hypothetical protein